MNMQYCHDTASLPGLPPGGPAQEPAPDHGAPVGARRGALPVMSQAEKAARAGAKRSAILAFLASGEVWTTADIAAQLIGASKRRAVATLDAMERDALIASETLAYGGRSLKLYGITPHGLATVGAFDAPHFERGRTNPAYIQHRLEGQRCRLAAETAGWTGWQSERALRMRAVAEKWRKIPDALAINPAGEAVAIEVERFCKTPKRYADLIVSYLQEIKAGRYKYVDFVCPPGVETLVQRAMERVTTVKVGGESAQITDAHRARFCYYSFDNWPAGVNHG
jgi:hypothetical protein